MTDNKKLEDFAREIQACVKCGICQAHCPAYLDSRREGAVARGKIALAAALLTGGAALETRLEEDISMCLMCGSCMQKCPNKVPTHEIVGAIRRQITANKGLSLVGRGVSTLIGSARLMKTATKTGALLAPLLLKKVPESSGLRLRFPITAMAERTLPKIAFRNLFDRLPEFLPGRPEMPTIGFFAGCAITYAYPEIGETMVAILQRLGYSVFLPRRQQCCGIPALSAGNGELVATLAEANVKAFSEFGERQPTWIVTACASCNGGIGEYYRTMPAGYGEFTDKVIDFSVFLKQAGLVEQLAGLPRWPERTRVTYHDPCHLKIQGISKEPRELLRALPNIEFVEMEGADACCGLGGTFSVNHYQSSKAIGARKIPGLRDSGATLIATACPGCIIQLQDSINHAGLTVRAVHILDLVPAALAKE